MPDLTIVNNYSEKVHVAFFITAPTHWKNNLAPGERWTTHLPSLHLHFEIRWAERDDGDGNIRRSQEFSAEGSWEMGRTIGLACAAGTASVLVGGASMVTRSPIVPLIGAAGALMKLACDGGNKYAAMGTDTRLYATRIWVPWFDHKEYSVRSVNGCCVLWDVRENKQV